MTGPAAAEVLVLVKHNKLIGARSILFYWGMGQLGISQTQLSRVFWISQPAVSMAVSRGERLVEDHKFSLAMNNL
jgi:hypothetical protein